MKKKQIFLNILSNYAGRAVGMLLGIFLVPFLIWKLGVEIFGLVVVFESLMKFMEMVSGSIRVALSRHATFSLSQDKQDEFVAYLSTGRGIYFVLSFLVLIFGFAISFWIPDILRLPAGRHHECQQYFALITAAFAITVPNIVFWAGLYAKQRFDLINLSSSAGVILRAVAIFVIFSVVPKEHLSLVTYGWIYLVMTWSQNYAIFFAFKKLMPEVHVRLKYFQKEKIREILSFAGYTLSGNMSQVLNENAMNFMINILWGPAANAIFGVGCKFSSLLESIFLESTWTLTPTFTELVARDQKEKLKTLLFLFTKVMTILCLPIFLALMIFSRPILSKWVGPGFELAPYIMIFSILPQCIFIPIASTHNLPNAFGKVKWPGVINPVNDVCCVATAYLFAVPLKFGLMGMVMGPAICGILMAFLFAVPYGCYLAGFSTIEYWLKAYFRPMIWAVFFWLPALFLLLSWKPYLWLSLPGLLTLAGLTPFYAAGVYFLVLDGKDKNYVHDFIKLALLKTRAS